MNTSLPLRSGQTVEQYRDYLIAVKRLIDDDQANAMQIREFGIFWPVVVREMKERA